MKPIAIAVFCAVSLSAQVERASIVGTITDRSGEAIPDALVQVTHEGTNTMLVVRTGDSGNFSAPNLAPGSYPVTAEKPGFSRAVIRGFVIQVGQAARLDVTMEVGTVEQSVAVEAAAPLLETEDSSVGQVIAPEPIAALPLNGRNFVQLAILAPGVSGLNYSSPAPLTAVFGRMSSAPAAPPFRPTVSAATASGSPTNTGAGTRADVVPGVNPNLNDRSIDRWFNVAAFTFPVPFNWGNAGRNSLTGPPIYNFDFTLSKKFPWGEQRSVMFRSEFFNAFNTPQFTLPASTIGATGVATISSTARPSRQIQFALKVGF